MRKPLKIIVKCRGSNFWFCVYGRNGAITSTSEMYTRKHNAIKTAQTYIDNGLNAIIYYRKLS